MNSSATAVSLREKFGQFTEHWSPKKIAALNDYEIKIVKIKGDSSGTPTPTPTKCSW